MTWVRLDEGFARHPKVAAAGPLAIAMQVAGLCYCNQNLTDGFIPAPVARTLLDWQFELNDAPFQLAVTNGMSGHDVDSKLVLELMVESGLWDKERGGYRIHDFHDYQPTREHVLEEREQRRAAGRKGGLATRDKAKGAATAQAGATADAQAPAAAEVKQALEQNDSSRSSKTEAEGVAKPQPVSVPVEDQNPVTVTVLQDQPGNGGGNETDFQPLDAAAEFIALATGSDE